MGLTNKLNECVQEVDVIIAGGKSRLISCYVHKGQMANYDCLQGALPRA